MSYLSLPPSFYFFLYFSLSLSPLSLWKVRSFEEQCKGSVCHIRTQMPSFPSWQLGPQSLTLELSSKTILGREHHGWEGELLAPRIVFSPYQRENCKVSYLTICVPTKVSLSLGARHASKSPSLSGELRESQNANKCAELMSSVKDRMLDGKT